MDKNEITKKALMFGLALGISIASTALSKTMVTLITDNILAPTVEAVVNNAVPAS